MQIFSSNTAKTCLSAFLTVSLSFSLSVNADESEQIKSSLMSRMTSSTNAFISTGVKALLSPNFNTVEVSTNLKEGDSSVDIGALKAYGDNPNSFIFNQINLNRFDKRTTLNLGLGYRRLNADETLMTGVNVFYDHEFPDNHTRSGVGVELISSPIQLRANMYNGISGFKNDKSGTDSKALDGHDVSLKVALPYMPGAFFEYNKYKWEAEENAKDAEGKKYSLGGNLSDNLSFNFVRTDYDDASKNDINRVQLTYSWHFGGVSNKPTLFEISNKAYQLRELTTQKYDLVKRENRIIKQKKFGATASGF